MEHDVKIHKILSINGNLVKLDNALEYQADNEICTEIKQAMIDSQPIAVNLGNGKVLSTACLLKHKIKDITSVDDLYKVSLRTGAAILKLSADKENTLSLLQKAQKDNQEIWISSSAKGEIYDVMLEGK